MYNVHRGVYLQRGKGFGGIFSSLFRLLRPLVSRGFSSAVKGGKKILADKDVQASLQQVKRSALKSGATAVDKALNTAQAKAVKRAQKRVLTSANLKSRKAKKMKSIFETK